MLLGLAISAEAKSASEEYLDYIDGLAETYEVDPYLIQSMIFYESSWCVGAVSETGCIGLMQINPGCHKERMKRLGVTKLDNGYQNMLVGIDFLAELLETYEDPYKAIDAYNGNLHSDKWYEDGNKTRYSERVMKLANELKKGEPICCEQTDSILKNEQLHCSRKVMK